VPTVAVGAHDSSADEAQLAWEPRMDQ
jgi:hypothetical protein